MTTHSQRALILYRRRRFINHLLTYLRQPGIPTYDRAAVRSLTADTNHRPGYHLRIDVGSGHVVNIE